MKKYKDLCSEKYTGYEYFCYTCRKQILESSPAPCPVCGSEDMKIHIWKDVNLQCSYADIKQEYKR